MEHRQVENMGLKEINRIPFQNLNIERFVQPEFGIVYNVNPEIRRIMIQEYPYRLTEGRLMFLRQGQSHARINLEEVTVKAPAIVIISPGTIGQMIEAKVPERFVERLLASFGQRLCLHRTILCDDLVGSPNLRTPARRAPIVAPSPVARVVYSRKTAIPRGGEAAEPAGTVVQPVHRFGQPIRQDRTERLLLCRQTLLDSALLEQCGQAGQPAYGDGLGQRFGHP